MADSEARPIERERIREHQRERWTGAALEWDRHREYISGMTRPVTDQIVRMLRLQPGERVLDLACGAGDPAFTLAEHVGPGGQVLGLDLAPPMIDAARARGRAAGLTNVEFRAIPSEMELGVADAQFDAATCRFGLMFMPDPVAALRTLRRALKPGGRVAVSTWGPAERNPLGALRHAIVARHAPVPDLSMLDPSGPMLDSIQELEDVLAAAGFAEARAVAVPVVAGWADTADEFWERQSRQTMWLRTVLASLSAEVQAAIRADAVRTIGAMFPGGRVEFPGEALVAMGIRG